MSCQRKVDLADDVNPPFVAPPADRVFNLSPIMPNGLAKTVELVVTLKPFRHVVLPSTVTCTLELFVLLAGVWTSTGPAIVSVPPGVVVRMPTGDLTLVTELANVAAFIRVTAITTTDGAEGIEVCSEQSEGPSCP